MRKLDVVCFVVEHMTVLAALTPALKAQLQGGGKRNVPRRRSLGASSYTLSMASKMALSSFAALSGIWFVSRPTNNHRNANRNCRFSCVFASENGFMRTR